MGTYDCGLFAVAFATAEAHGRDPNACNFDQTAMRRHLYNCLSTGKLSPFPEIKPAYNHGCGLTSSDDISVHCYCRMPEIKGTPMVECSSCLKWFHVTCCQGSLSADQLNSSDIEWFCSFCA